MTALAAGGLVAFLVASAGGDAFADAAAARVHAVGGCPGDRGRLAVVAGGRAGVPAPALDPLLADLVADRAARGAEVSVFSVEGTPARWFHDALPLLTGGDGRRTAAVEGFVRSVGDALAAGRATTPEADDLAALSLAAAQVGRGGVIVLLDSGLQTVAPLRFPDAGTVEADAPDVAADLAQRKLLPDLAGRTLILDGVGDTAAPQAPLGNPARGNLIDIWTEIGQAAGACVAVDDAPHAVAGPDRAPPVTQVPRPARTYALSCASPLRLGQNDLYFRPGTATFRDADGVRAILRPVAATLIARDRTVRLIGTTAAEGTVQSRLTLAENRAAAVRDVLIALGVPAARVSAIGVGTGSSYYVPDTGDGGALIPTIAARNRSVILQLDCG